jgi:hypothetical protein
MTDSVRGNNDGVRAALLGDAVWVKVEGVGLQRRGDAPGCRGQVALSVDADKVVRLRGLAVTLRS